MFLPGDGRMEVLGADPSPGTRRSFRGQVMLRSNWNADLNESMMNSRCVFLRRNANIKRCRYRGQWVC